MNHFLKPPIKVGLLAPLSGIVGLYGTEISRAAKIAADIVNEEGGVLGRPLEIIIADDGSIPQTAVPAAQNLIKDQKCHALIGNLLSNSRISVAYQVAEPLKIPYLNFSFYEGSISSPYFFHFAALPNQQIDKMIPYMLELKGPKMFLAGSDYEWPHGSIDAAKKALEKCGGEVVGEEYYPLGEADIKSLLNEVAKSGADVFVPYFAGQEQADLLISFTEKGLKSKMSVVMGHYDEAMVQGLPPEVREGLYSSNSYFMTIDTNENRDYLKRMAALKDVDGIWPHGNGVLTNFGEGTYLCVRAYADAVNRAGNMETTDILSALRTISIKGPQGSVKMDPYTQHAAVNGFLAKCNADGQFDIIKGFGLERPIIPDRYRQLHNDNLTEKDDQVIEVQQPFDVDSFENIVKSQKAHDGPGLLFSTAFNFVDVGLVAINAASKIVQVNLVAEQMFGYQPEEILGKPISILIPPRYRSGHGNHIMSFIKSDSNHVLMGQRGEISGYSKDGREIPIEASITTFQSGGETYYTAMLREVTKYKRIEKELKWQASHDSLTGLPNRKIFMERLEKALERTSTTGKDIAVLFIDLDNFKMVNDSYGHVVGDQLLVLMGEKLLAVVGSGNIVARFGGDEFVVLCEKIKNEKTTTKLAMSINEKLREPIEIEGIKMFPSCSIGVAVGCSGDTSSKHLLSNADAAMYQAKEHGRDKWLPFNAEIYKRSRERLDVANGLRMAIEKDEFSCVFQPIVDTNSHKMVGMEILLRWTPESGPVSPAIFIPVAEMTGSIYSIGSWVFEQACKAQVRLTEAFGYQNCPYVSVNVSSRQLETESFFKDICRTYNDIGANSNGIIIEVTETALMADVDINIRVLKALGMAGFKVAIDDFGTGYSSLSLLTKLPLSLLKVDREFVKNLELSDQEKSVAKAVIGLAHSLGLKTVAEGVETEGQRAILSDLNATYCQGYFFSKPAPLENIINQYGNQTF